LKLKNKKVIVGLALTGVGLIASEIKKRRKIDELTKKVYYTEDFLEDLDEKIWSLNRSMKEIAKAHNSLIKMATDDYEDFDERIYEIEDEIATIYSHLAELDKIKKNRKGVSESKTILKSKSDELEESTDDSEEKEIDLGGIIEKLME
jgi:DNA repair exonuclease SbcCD ATPase subunit